MFRAIVGSILGLAIAAPALAASEIDTCRDTGATSEARLAACSAVIADATTAGGPKAAAHAYVGDSLAKSATTTARSWPSPRRMKPTPKTSST